MHYLYIRYYVWIYFVILYWFAGQCLNFNCTFVLVLMLRHCITFLRTRGFSLFLPLDQHICFHKITGFFIFGYSILHTFMHLLNFSKLFILHRLSIFPLPFDYNCSRSIFYHYRYRHNIWSKLELRRIHSIRMAIYHRPGTLRTHIWICQSNGCIANCYSVRDVHLFTAIRSPRRMLRG